MNRYYIVFLLVIFICTFFQVSSQSFKTISPKNNQIVFSTNTLIWENYQSDFDNYIVRLSNSTTNIDTAIFKNSLKLNLPLGDYSWKVLVEKGGQFIDSTSSLNFKVFSPKSVDSLSLWLIA
ncbi:MAG: hypothetical protein WD512_18535, partial [Candidatus Paceibacterota bacterium]